MKKGCLVIFGLLAVLGLTALVGIKFMANQYETQPKSPGELECNAAEDFILSYKDKEATGNTPEAIQFAEEFARDLRTSRQALFTEGKEGATTLSKGHFLTYCFAKNDSVAVLVHIPELRRYTEDAKVTLAEFSWSLATLEARKKFPQATKLAVGIKGVMNYSAIFTGVITKSEDPVQGIQTRHPVVSTKPLWPFFAPGSEQPAQ